ncbi:hypothetical protein AO365_0588 [Moraxella catarrhalis]|nr:hypothetical protein AO365_0588 [Moraxella catarrhalis]
MTWLQKTTAGYPKLHAVVVILDEMFWFAEFLAVYQLPALGDA